MSATLGGLIKDYRLQKNISQLEIAFALGWKEPSRLSRIEQGKVGKPSRDLINKLISALKLSEEEKNYLLFTGGYLPTDEEIELFRKKIKPRLTEWPYPASSMDFSWRIVLDNKLIYSVFDVSKKQQQIIYDTKPRIFEIVFHPKFILNNFTTSENEQKRREFLVRMLFHFQYAQRDRTRESWYLHFMKKMMNNDLYKQLWTESQNYTPGPHDVTNYTPKFAIPTKEGINLNFHMFIVPVMKDPRFTIEFHLPADRQTFDYFQKKV